MKRSPQSPPRWSRAAVLLAAVVLAACSAATGTSAPSVVQPGAPGEPGRTVAAGETAAPGRPRHTEADVRFMQGMIAHHQQALEMTSLVPERSTRDDVRLLARRIEIAQSGEIGMMRSWLASHGEEVPGAHAHHGAGGHAALMPGMLTAQEMARLAAARGAGFDRLLLEYMIRHHEGALAMVEDLFTHRGAGQEGEVYQFAAEVAGDQRIEIDRMRRMLGAVR